MKLHTSFRRLFLSLTIVATLLGGSAYQRAQAIFYPGGSTYASPQEVKVLPRIAINSTGFYDVTTGKVFMPRGANFVRLATSPSGLTYHSTFEPGQYHGPSAQSILTSLKSSGYNTVRIFIDPGEFTISSHGISAGVNSTDPIRADYMANVVDFVKQANARNMYVVPILDGIPANTYYYNTAGSPAGNIKGNNVLYLDPRYVQAKEIYVKAFVAALQAGVTRGTNAAANGILAYQTDNEVFFEGNQPPFNTMSGTLTSLNGVTYNMAQASQRQQAADASLVEYSARMKQAIIAADPKGLLTLGFFTNNAVGKSAFNGLVTSCTTRCDYRFPGRPAAVSIYGKADFIDMHAYPWSTSYSLKNDLASSEYTLFQKPYILGEFGALKSAYNNNVATAASAMKNLQIASCSLKARGWLFWTWDTSLVTSLANQKLFYSLRDSNNAINKQLAPTVRPDPCR